MRTFLAPALVALAASAPAADTPAPAPVPSLAAPAPSLRLIDLSLVVMTAGGGSTARNDDLQSLQVGGHDPTRTGFTFQGAELSLAGAVDPYFTAQAHLAASEAHGVELEEAYATTSRLPGGWEVKAGYYLTEFGRTNASHAHAWSWIDRSLPAGRLLGGEGMRGSGVHADWVAPTDTYLRLGMGLQNADDPTMTSFLGGEGHDHEDGDEEAHGLGGLEPVEFEPRHGRDFLWSARAVTAYDLASDVTLQGGLSAALGPQASGPAARTVLAGADVTLRARTGTGDAGAGDLLIGLDAILREVRLDRRSWDTWDGVSPEDAPVGTGTLLEAGGTTLRDQGVAVEATYGVAPRWTVGVRGEWLRGRGDNWHVDELSEDIATSVEEEDRNDDATRSDRTRIAPLILFQPSEFTKLRLQYAYDRAAHLEDPVHSVWVGLEVLIGAHPAHGF